MITEKKLVKLIIDLESLVDPLDDCSYHDEAQQARLAALYEVLGRELNAQEQLKLDNVIDSIYGEG